MEKMSEKKRFSIVSRVKSANHAMRGFIILLKTGHNFWMHIFFTALAVYLGYILNISEAEWIFIVITVGIVLLAEAFNTAIEIDIDLTSPNYHPYARDTKDVAAASVIISVLIACIVGLIIFLPKIFALYF
ncbi:MAG: diacylglycerol kinase family protein [Candidatus Nomurabacteria bacterium]|nr:diacylglycerol kinase family protein [Candidatus Nomurabacteria bacterium]